ncbi:MAG: geranylgeranylglyceryl/heptaprenylglyceryl phosphate synthase [Bacteroidales bacterium]|nr:geranylgeranylglyceryl/heptaprenylglyceryl phosphate synthase [Bacteroidales bacterium]
MLKKNIYQQIEEARIKSRKLIAMLIDPDKFSKENLVQNLKSEKLTKPDFIFVGGSFLSSDLDTCIDEIKSVCELPIILFPGNACQISNKADAILLLSLISGRNPEFLIGNHVNAAPFLKKSNLEIISTGYILVGSNNNSSVEYISNTKPIPADKTDIAIATALAGEMLGMQLIYLEAGSGAKQSIPNEMVKTISENCKCPIIVGGGIRTKNEIKEKFDAGASIVVIGNAWE